MSVEVIDPASAAGIASAALAQALTTLQQVIVQATAAAGSATAAAASQAAVTAMLKALGVTYRWTGTSLQLMLPDGTYGPAVDLQGVMGATGPAPTFSIGTVTVGSSPSFAFNPDPSTPNHYIVDVVVPQGAPGNPGTSGANGWAPVLTLVANGSAEVLEVTDWTGGSGTKPTTGVYVGASGFTSNIANAVNLKGANGAGAGNVNPSGTINAGHLAVFGDGTGNLISDGGALSTFGASLVAALTNTAVKTLLEIGVADVSGAQAALGFTPENSANKGQASGYAGLDGSGKVPTSQLPAAVLGALNYQGTWNASANSPALGSGTGTKGYFYVVSVAGTATLDGISQWNVGDWASYDGAEWRKVDGVAGEVLSVAGLVGTVTAAALKTALATVSTDIADATTVGKALLTAASATAAKAALSLAIGDISGAAALAGSAFTGIVTVQTPAQGSAQAATAAYAEGRGFQIGDHLTTWRTPSSSWLKRDGSYYNTSSYPTLAALLPGNGSSKLTQSFTETVGGFNAIAWSSTLAIWVAVGDNQSIYSSPGTSMGPTGPWTQQAAPSATTGNYVGVSWSSGLAAFGLVSSAGYYAYSTDGINWTKGGSRATSNTGLAIFGVAGGFVISWNNAGTGGLSYATAVAGSTWNVVSPAPGFLVNAIGSLISGGYVFVGAGGTIKTAASVGTTGTTYSTPTSGTTQALYGIQQITSTAFGTLAYVTGANGTLLTSPDGVTWTARTTGLTNNLRGVAVMNNALRVFGDGGQAAYSTDLAAYTAQTLSISYNIEAVATDGTNVVLGASAGGDGYLYNLGTTAGTQFQVPSDQPASGTGYIRALAA